MPILCSALWPNSLHWFNPSSATSAIFGSGRASWRTRGTANCLSRDVPGQVRRSQSVVCPWVLQRKRSAWPIGESFYHLKEGKEKGKPNLHVLSNGFNFPLQEKVCMEGGFVPHYSSLSSISVMSNEINVIVFEDSHRRSKGLCFWSYLLYFVFKVVGIYWRNKHVNMHSKVLYQKGESRDIFITILIIMLCTSLVTQHCYFLLLNMI